MTTMTNRGTKMVAKYPGQCAHCEGEIARGSEMVWYRTTKRTWHVDCARAESLRGKASALWFKAMERGGRDESHYRPLAEAADRERDALVAAIEARKTAEV